MLDLKSNLEALPASEGPTPEDKAMVQKFAMSDFGVTFFASIADSRVESHEYGPVTITMGPEHSLDFGEHFRVTLRDLIVEEIGWFRHGDGSLDDKDKATLESLARRLEEEAAFIRSQIGAH